MKHKSKQAFQRNEFCFLMSQGEKETKSRQGGITKSTLFILTTFSKAKKSQCRKEINFWSPKTTYLWHKWSTKKNKKFPCLQQTACISFMIFSLFRLIRRLSRNIRTPSLMLPKDLFFCILTTLAKTRDMGIFTFRMQKDSSTLSQ